MKKIGKKTLILHIVMLVVLLALLVTGVTYAVWTTTATATQDIDIPQTTTNPSEKYILFSGLDEDGHLTSDPEEIASYAVVGYDGLVANVEIPATHEDVENEISPLPVTEIRIDPSIPQNKWLTHNPIITSLVIPSSVTRIASGVCQDMSLLESVTLQSGADELVIEDYAFAFCTRLTTFSSSRTITGSTTYLYGTPSDQAGA